MDIFDISEPIFFFCYNIFIKRIPSPNELLYAHKATGCIIELGELIVCFEQVKSFQTARIEWLNNGEWSIIIHKYYSGILVSIQNILYPFIFIKV